jgi:flagellar motor switch protein FliG
MEQLDALPTSAFTEPPVDRIGAILNSSPARTRDSVLDGLGQTDADFAELVRKAIFTFANIAERLEARDAPKITRDVEATLLVTALTAALAGSETEKVSAEFILSNMSQRMASQLREEIAERGKVKASEGEEAMGAVIEAIRDLESEGEITLLNPDEEEE